MKVLEDMFNEEQIDKVIHNYIDTSKKWQDLCKLVKTIQFPPKYRQFFYINPLISLEKSTFYASKFLKRGEQQLCRPLVFWIIYIPDIWENQKQIIAGEKKSVDLILLSTSKI